MAGLRMRLWMTSLLVGCTISCAITFTVWITKIGPWFPPFWPGWFLAIASQAVVIVIGRGELDYRVGLALVTIGNGAFYAWISLRIMKADVTSRRRIGKHFLR
jgi:hypothetical protein